VYHQCVIAGGCMVLGVCEDVTSGGCVSAVGYCNVDVDHDVP
jgi:hypothetical protein